MTAGPIQPRLVCLSTYPPRECGIATFSRDLIQALKIIEPQLEVRVAALNITSDESLSYPQEVQWQLDQNKSEDFVRLAEALNAESGVSVLIEHEYGIFGGAYGEHLLEFLRVFEGTVFTILHTTLPQPNEEMRAVTQELINRSALVQVFSERSAQIVRSLYGIDSPKLLVLPHGIHPVVFFPPAPAQESLGYESRTLLTTFGMLSRGKGIEYVLQALPPVIQQHPEVLYLIIGATHPVIRKQEGEKYRSELQELVQELKLEQNVQFVDRYLPTHEVLEFLQATDIYIATPLSPEQAVSGTFSYALGTGRAVISTAFSQAEATLNAEVGLLVPVRNAEAYTQALLSLLADRGRLPIMHEAAYRQTRKMLWTNVAHALLQAFHQASGDAWLAYPPISLKHLRDMTTQKGLVQFAQHSKPDQQTGYTLDDNARALIAGYRAIALFPELRSELEPLLKIFLTCIKHCLRIEKQTVNYIGSDGKTPTEQNTQENPEDSWGRAIWAIGELIGTQELSTKEEQELWQELKKLSSHPFQHIRALSFALLGVSSSLRHPSAPEHTWLLPWLESATATLIAQYRTQADHDWLWFEPQLVYANAFLPLALLQASRHLPDSPAAALGLEALEFLASVTFYEDVYVPIGQNEWFVRHSTRGLFDQQPEDTSAMVLACAGAYAVTKDSLWQKRAEQAFSWFLGNNLLSKRLYDDRTGGCYDGLTPSGVNQNQGAESLVSYLLARLAVEHSA